MHHVEGLTAAIFEVPPAIFRQSINQRLPKNAIETEIAPMPQIPSTASIEDGYLISIASHSKRENKFHRSTVAGPVD